LAVPLGLGLSSVGFFLWLAAIGPNVTGLFVLEIAALLTLTTISVRRRAAAGESIEAVGAVNAPGQMRLLVVTGVALVVLSLISFGALSATNPHGWWDAVSIWNLRARFLFRGGEYWTDMFTPLLPWSHPDYPLLLSGSIARAWKFAGADATAGAIAVAALFSFATVGLLASATSALRGRGQGALAAIVLMGSGMLIWQGATQYADVPLGLFVLAALAMLALSDRGAGYRGLAVAGLLAGLAAWTKNEGLLFVLALLVARFAIVVRYRGWKPGVKDIGAMLVGLGPMLLLILWFKLTLAPPNDLIATVHLSDVFARLTDPARYWLLSKTFLDLFFYFGSPWIGMPLLLVLYALFAGRDPRVEDRKAIATTFISLGLVLAGYCLVFIVTPHDPQWHLDTAFYRLVMHLWPGLLFGYFLMTKSPALEGQGSSLAV
jgi:hypothetical protein